MVESELDARAVVNAFLREVLAPAIGKDLGITSVMEFSTCWAVGYNTQAYLKSGNFRHSLIGGGLLIVNRKTGNVRRGTWNETVESQLDAS